VTPQSSSEVVGTSAPQTTAPATGDATDSPESDDRTPPVDAVVIPAATETPATATNAPDDVSHGDAVSSVAHSSFESGRQHGEAVSSVAREHSSTTEQATEAEETDSDETESGKAESDKTESHKTESDKTGTDDSATADDSGSDSGSADHSGSDRSGKGGHGADD
jgi:hypothetical protein